MDRQRYMINAGRSGCDIAAFAEDLEDRIRKLDPKVVDYLIGREDYCKGEKNVDSFGESLTLVASKSLAMRDNSGFFVIQLPHAVSDETENEIISLYAAKAREVMERMPTESKSRIVLVDHFAQTNHVEVACCLQRKDL